MDIKPIRSEADYKEALALVSSLIDLDPDPASPEGEQMEIVGTLIEAYERTHYSIAPPAPVAAIKFRMEQQGLTIKDLEPLIGKSNRVYEVFSGSRTLTLPMIRRLHQALKIPVDVLIQEV